jgi:alkyldihydroxyacetonephosphate synthase
MAGISGLEPVEPVPLEMIEISACRVARPARLSEIISSEREARIRHTYGRSYRDLIRGFSGVFSGAPDLVACPKDEDDVVAILDWACGANVAVVPYGGGTSVVGGVECTEDKGFHGVLSLDVRGLDRVLEADPVSRAARIQAGATGPLLQRQLATHGLALRHYPQSYEFSTLGGWIATRAGGHYATLRTHIDDLVQSVRMVTPSGLYETPRLPGSGAGPDPARVVMGSEGTLGVITEAWMRVAPRPRFRAKVNILFDDFRRAVDATRQISQSGLHPANCRLLDAAEARQNMVTTDGSCVLLLGFESHDHPVRGGLERAMAIAESAGGRPDGAPRFRDDTDASASGRWRDAFFEMPYLQNAMVSVGMVADTFETACTWDRFEVLHGAILDGVKAAMGAVAGQGLISTRFTHVYPDGPAPYYTFLAPARRGAELEQWAAIKAAASEAIVENGGTITHHHAVGRTHRPWYERERPETFDRGFRAFKGALDPAGVMNPGALFTPAAVDTPTQSK